MPALIATIGANADPMRRELLAVQAMSAQTGVALKRNLEMGGHSGQAGIIRETIVVLRELLSGRFNARTAGSVSILSQRLGILSYFVKATNTETKALAATQTAQAAAAALAADNSFVLANAHLKEASAELLSEYADKEKAESALQVAASEYLAASATKAKTLATYEAAKATEASAAAAGFAVTPLGWLAIALIAIGTAAFFTIRHFRQVQEELKNLRDLTDTTTVNFKTQAEALREAADAAQSFDDWLKKIGESEEGLAKKTQESLRLMRERAKYERELAQEKGATRKELAAMDIAEQQKELDAITTAKLQARRKLEDDLDAAKDAERDAENFDRSSNIGGVKEKALQAGELFNAVKEKLKTETKSVIDPEMSRLAAQGGGIGPVYKNVPLDGNDKVTVKVDGKEYTLSLNEAQKAFNDVTQKATELAAVQKQITDILNQKKQLTEKDKADLATLEGEANQKSAELALAKEFLPSIADHARGHQVHGHVNSLQQVGAFTTASVDVQKAQLAATRNIVTGVHTIIGHLGNGGNGKGTGVKH
jgi:hypothetical protein